jgi:hypothetical protein
MGLVSSACHWRAHTVEFDRLRGTHMDRGDSLRLLPVQVGTPRGQCASCATAQRAADRRTGRLADHVDDDVVVMSGTEFEGFVVVPRLHVNGLEELPLSCRANILAAVQRAARAVREENPWSTARIVVLTDLPASEGHMCIHVLPGDADNSMVSEKTTGGQQNAVH